jgi:hypothetical protein
MLGSRIQKVGKNMDDIIQVKPFGSVHDVELCFKPSLFAGFDGNWDLDWCFFGDIRV